MQALDVSADWRNHQSLSTRHIGFGEDATVPIDTHVYVYIGESVNLRGTFLSWQIKEASGNAGYPVKNRIPAKRQKAQPNKKMETHHIQIRTAPFRPAKYKSQKSPIKYAFPRI